MLIKPGYNRLNRSRVLRCGQDGRYLPEEESGWCYSQYLTHAEVCAWERGWGVGGHYSCSSARCSARCTCTTRCTMHMQDGMQDAHAHSLYYAHTHSLCTCTMRCTMRCTVQQVRLRKSGLGSDAASASACGFVPGEGLRCAGAEQGKAKQARQWEGTCVTAAAWLESAPQLLKWTTMTASTTKVSQPYMCERLQPCVEVAALCVHPGLQGRPCMYHQGAPWRLGRRTQRDVRRRTPARRRGGRWRGALRPLERLPQPHSRGLRR